MKASIAGQLDARKRQIRQAAVRKRIGMIRCPGRAPDCRARDIEAYGDFGELGADGLVLDQAASSLDAQLRVIERRFVGGREAAFEAKQTVEGVGIR